MMGDRPGLSDAEREVLKALWGHGPATVRQLNGVLGGQGRSWAYTTVLTLLQRLQGKGYVVSDGAASGSAHVFRASVSRDELLEQRLKDTADELCDGSAAPLLLALVQGNRFSAEELARLRRMIDEAGRGQPRPGSGA
ncbi:MAG: BlaI/MecI/CopY family transcriptional regulator [Isosphaeraceae bacterium]